MINCPCCENPIDVTIDPGQKKISYPTRRAQPAYPPQVDEIRGCECWEHHWDDNGEYEDEVMRRVWDAREAARSVAIDREIDEMRDRRLAREDR